MQTASVTKVWNRGFILIFIANLFQLMGQQTITTLVPKYAASMGATSTIIGIISGIFAVSAIAIRPVASPAFDCFSKKNIYSLSNIIVILSYLLFFLAPNTSLLIAGRLLQGVGVGISGPIALSIACDNLPQNGFAKGVSMFTLGQAVGQAIGPGIGLSLSKTIGYRTTFIICLMMIVLALVTSRFVYSAAPPADAKYQIRVSTIVAKEALPTAVTMIFVVIPYATITGFLAIYGDILGIEQIGLFFTVYAVALVVLRFVTGGMADRFGYRKVLLPSLASYAVTFILFSVSKNLAGFILAALFAAFGYGLLLPNMQALCMTSVPPERRGVGGNTFFLGQDIGSFFGPYIAGLSADYLIVKGIAAGLTENAAMQTAYSKTFLVIIVSLAIAAVLVLRITRNLKTKKTGAD